MPRYQVQYKNNSKTFNDIFESRSEFDILDFFTNVVNAEVFEIREILYENPTYPKDDGNYRKYIKIKIQRDNYSNSLTIPKVKKTISSQTVLQLVKDYLKLQGLAPTKIDVFL